MFVLQNFYMTLLNLIFRITGKIDEKIRNRIVQFSLFFLSVDYFVWQSFSFFHIMISQTEKSIIGCGLLCFIIVMSIKEKLHKIKWNMFLWGIWSICSILIILSGFLHVVGDGVRPLGFIMLFGFPCLYFVWNNRRDYETFFNWVAKAFMITMVLYFVACIFVAPLEVTERFGFRYAATTHNPNRLGMLCAAAVSSCLYLYANPKRNSWIYLFPCGIAVSFAFLSMSRASLLAIIVPVVLVAVFFIKNNDVFKMSRRGAVLKMMILVLGMVICIPIVSTILTTGNSVVGSASEMISEKYVVFAQEENKSVAEDSYQEREKYLKDRLGTAGKDLNSLSSGRIEVWTYYLKHLNWWGHSMKSPTVEVGGVALYGAHNTPLDIGYRCGIIDRKSVV